MWGLSLERLWTSRCYWGTGSLAPEAANLTVRNLGHMARREQAPESAPERKNIMQAQMYCGNKRNIWDVIREEISNKPRKTDGWRNMVVTDRDTYSAVSSDIFSRKVLGVFIYTVFSKLKHFFNHSRTLCLNADKRSRTRGPMVVVEHGLKPLLTIVRVGRFDG